MKLIKPLITFILLLAALALTSCNVQPANATATSLAATTTADAANPSATPFPSPTTLPSATAMLPPTQTPTPTATSGPSPTPTYPPLPPDDPRQGLNLSSPDYLDNFDNRFTWYEFDYENIATNLWEDGQLRATDHLADTYLSWSTSNQQAANFYVEVTAKMGNCAGKDNAGLAIRIGGDNYGRGYLLEFACDGSYRIRKFYSDAAPLVLLDWTNTPLIRTGPNSTNRVGFVAKGNTLYAAANGEILSNVEDYSYFSGTFGLFANAYETPGLTVYFDDFSLWYLEP